MNGQSKQCKASFSEFWDRVLGNGQDESFSKRELNKVLAVMWMQAVFVMTGKGCSNGC